MIDTSLLNDAIYLTFGVLFVVQFVSDSVPAQLRNKMGARPGSEFPSLL